MPAEPHDIDGIAKAFDIHIPHGPAHIRAAFCEPAEQRAQKADPRRKGGAHAGKAHDGVGRAQFKCPLFGAVGRGGGHGFGSKDCE